MRRMCSKARFKCGHRPFRGTEHHPCRHVWTYLKTKNFHWHMSALTSATFTLLLDEHAGQIFATTDALAERVRKIGGTTIRSMGHIGRLQRVLDNDADFVTSLDMLAELRDDNKQLATNLRETHGLAQACWKPGSMRPSGAHGSRSRRPAVRRPATTDRGRKIMIAQSFDAARDTVRRIVSDHSSRSADARTGGPLSRLFALGCLLARWRARKDSNFRPPDS
jgi:hypothetical protein